ncbi:lasso peptide biosynthesis PqqD family chaperone [Paenibacillus nasutitermitis]|uniref:Lasso peptide biosynthesis PqqD family chaperone n=1 Tax=Paenibacillus nasutitermitis TaxID=1652958 RepID=A0A916Z2N6_9BACL|nr:lasso peptide biosynthesis PqqD family chaperone [Paenibacillus nasutitermitis]GGD73214.1 hypothetical protein GCM10010911_33820 [Paenibacillus nasutitermitis]
MSASNLLLTGFVSQCPGNIVSDMDGEKVMLSVQNGKYYNLGETGGRIWDLIGSSTPIAGILSALTAEYEVDHNECKENMLSFLNHLHHHQLITFSNAEGQ